MPFDLQASSTTSNQLAGNWPPVIALLIAAFETPSSRTKKSLPKCAHMSVTVFMNELWYTFYVLTRRNFFERSQYVY